MAGGTAEMTDAMLGLRRAAEMAAIFMIGDGVLGMMQPRRHVDLWRSDMAVVDTLVRPFGGRPTRRRWYGAAQIAAGLMLAAAMRPRRSGTPSRERHRDTGPA